MRFLISTGQGAAAWITWRHDDTSYLAFVSSGRASMRWNMVGTMCEVVHRYRWPKARVGSAPHLSIRTTVWPMCRELRPKVMAAVWYSGAGTRWTLSSLGWIPNSDSSRLAMPKAVAGATSPRGRRTPLGFPVVPDV